MAVSLITVIFICTLTMVGVISARAIITSYSMEGPMSEMPDTLSMDIPMGNTTVSLWLFKSDLVPDDIPVLLATDQQSFVLWDDDEKDEFVLYHNNQSSFVIWRSENTGDLGMMGVFEHGGRIYTIEPMETRLPSRQARYYSEDDIDEQRSSMVMMSGFRFTVREISESPKSMQGGNDYVPEEAKQLQDKVDNILQSMSASQPHGSFEIEVLVVVDHSIFQKWTQKSRSFVYKTREVEALNNIRLYFAQIINGMNSKYEEMDTDSDTMKVRVRPVAIYIAKSSSASFWTDMAPNKESYHSTFADRALEELEEWIKKQGNKLPPFDEAMLFTDHTLTFVGSSGSQRNVIGLSNVMGVCGEKRVSLNKDGGLYSSIQIGTNQLDRSMGIYPGSPLCSNFPNEPFNTENSARECRRAALWYFMEYLMHNNENCLTSRYNYNTAWDITASAPKHPGQRYTADEQCKFTNGLYSFHCLDDNNADGVCQELSCWKPFVGMCTSSQDDKGADDGTPCADNSWCMSGRCVQHPDAPGKQDKSCVHGDYTGIVDANSGYRCYELGIERPQKCYDAQFRKQCCDTCNRVRREDIRGTGCEYGDKDVAFCHYELKPSDCYEADIAEKCCESCQRYKMEIPDCEYGDKDSDCDYLTRDKTSCYHYNYTCCQTCPRKQVGVTGCEWGDRVSWCSKYSKSMCYDTLFVTECCEYCWRMKQGRLGCEWGDRGMQCSPDDCQDGPSGDLCCDTCRNVNARQTTTPVSAAATEKATATKPTNSRPITTTDKTTFSREPVTSSATTRSSTTSTTQTTTPRSITTSTRRTTSTVAPTTKSKTTMSTAESTTTTSTKTTTTTTEKSTKHSDHDGDNMKPEVDPIENEPLVPPCEDTSRYCHEVNEGSDCYDPFKQTSCCATCFKYKRANPHCEYGDKAHWCAGYVAREGIRVCETVQDVKTMCCESCQPRDVLHSAVVRHVVPPDCKDQANWCRNIFPGQCYSSTTRDTCCAACAQVDTGIDNCQYGDKYTWCKSGKHCASYKSDCCGTC